MAATETILRDQAAQISDHNARIKMLERDLVDLRKSSHGLRLKIPPDKVLLWATIVLVLATSGKDGAKELLGVLF